VVSPSHVQSCFEKQVLMLQSFDVGSCLRARGARGLRKKSNSESRVWASGGEAEVPLLSPYLAQIILCKVEATYSGCCRTGVEPQLLFLVHLCCEVEGDPGDGCCLPRALLISSGVDCKGSSGACSCFLPVLARTWTPCIWRGELW